ncbi:MAG: UDP-N-acetylmuramate--L-alanine ligase [Desulfovibrionaceae bacterium]|nr:UDP-N-acetylmuramate--L-alanine ligase [Desulfovibrionaceae bacterium]
MFSKTKHIHMVGIGGSGMSGIAEVLLSLGYTISGSDTIDSPVLQRLSSLGALIFTEHRPEHVANVDVVVQSNAISADNPEIIMAHQNNIPVIPRAEMLAELMRLRTGIAVGGTHGKTTTTSFLASIFSSANLDPTVIIGGKLNAINSNAYLGHGKFIIAEADESDASFLYLFPCITVVTNIDYDHLDFYSSQDEIDSVFIQFMNKIPFYGLNVVCGDDPGVQRVLPYIKRKILTYGFNTDNMLYAHVHRADTECHFTVYYLGKDIGTFILKHPGLHNILNALASIGVALACDISPEQCYEGLLTFRGVGRRFEQKGIVRGITVIDDYGHHPVEIKSTLATARACFPDKRIHVAFQPHRFTRTQALFGDFCSAFNDIDSLIVTEIYPASETPIPGVNGVNLAHGIKQVGIVPEVTFCATLDDVIDHLSSTVQEGDVVMTLGAGTITTVGSRLLERLG